MPAATDTQVQSFVNNYVRIHAERTRALVAAFDAAIAVIDDVYTALNVPAPTWSDQRPDGPPHLAEPADVLGYNGFIHDVRDYIKAHGQWPIIQKLCVKP